ALSCTLYVAVGCTGQLPSPAIGARGGREGERERERGCARNDGRARLFSISQSFFKRCSTGRRRPQAAVARTAWGRHDAAAIDPLSSKVATGVPQECRGRAHGRGRGEIAAGGGNGGQA